MGFWLILAFLGVSVLQYLVNRGNRSKAQPPGNIQTPRVAAGTPIPVFFGTVKVEPIVVAFSIDKVRRLEQAVGLAPAPFQTKQFLGWSYTISSIAILGWGPIHEWQDLVFDETRLFSQEPDTVGVVTAATSGGFDGIDAGTVALSPTGKGTLDAHASLLLPYVFGGAPPEGQGGITDGRDYDVPGHIDLTGRPANVYFFPGRLGDITGLFRYPSGLDVYVDAYAPVGQPFSFADQPRYTRFCYTAFDWVQVGTGQQLHKIEHVVRGDIGGLGGADNLDAEPIGVLLRILTDQEWGLGISEALIDVGSFNDAATLLGVLEQFGISGVMNVQKAGEDWIAEILRTIDAALYRHPVTGKLALQLIRGGYTVADLPAFDETNVLTCEWTRRDIGDTVNQVTIAFTDRGPAGLSLRRFLMERNTVTLTDHANVAATGSVRSQVMEFPWISTEARALAVGARELKAATLPLGTGTLTVDRVGWDVVPGDVRKLNWARLGLVDVPVRILSVGTGTLEDGSIQIEVVEDVYGQPDVPFTVADDPPSTPGIGAPDTSTPKVLTFPTADATTGYLTLVVIDPESRVTDVSFSTQSGSDPASGFATDAALPYATTVALSVGATSYIFWRVTWTDVHAVSQTIAGAVPYAASAGATGGDAGALFDDAGVIIPDDSGNTIFAG